MTNSQLDTTNESQEVSPFPAGDVHDDPLYILRWLQVIMSKYIIISFSEKVREYDQAIPQSNTAHQPTAQRGSTSKN